MKPALKLLSHAFRVIPPAVHTELLARLFNHLLRGQAVGERLHELENKRLAIEITDAGTLMTFMLRNGGFFRAGYQSASAWDVCIRGKLVHFWQMASREEDPDTLFFNRLLSIEGETATGLYIKNLLDALDYRWDAHFQAVLGKQAGGLLHRIMDTSWSSPPPI